MDERYVTEAVHDEFARRIDEHNKIQDSEIQALKTGLQEINKITNTIAKLTANIETLTEEIKKQGLRLDKIEERPVKRWDSVVSGVIAGIVGILIGLLSSGLVH